MGPYYLASLVHLLGPVRAVTGASSRLRAERVIGSGPRRGERIPVEVDSHVSGVLEHVAGTLTTITTSFDGVATTASPIEVHGEVGTLAVPDRTASTATYGSSDSATRSGARSLRPRATSTAHGEWGCSTSSPPTGSGHRARTANSPCT